MMGKIKFKGLVIISQHSIVYIRAVASHLFVRVLTTLLGVLDD